jgi:DNA-binding transcriptional LysR family regulator
MSILPALTFRQLRALKMVCETGSITGAAERLSLTPPAVHNQLKTLANTIGAEVVTRAASGAFAPTPEGASLLIAIEKSEAAVSRALYEIEALRRGVAGQVVLGVVSTGKYIAPGIVARLKRSHPEIEIRLEIGNRNQIIAGLESEWIDVAIMGRPPRQPSVTAYPIGNHPHLLIASPDNPLSKKTTASHDEILDQTIILREEGSGTRILAMRFLDRIGEGRPFRQIEMDSNETIKQAVIADLGVALISAHTVIDEMAAGRLVQIRAESLPIYRQWFVLYREELRLSGAMQSVIEAIRNESAAILRSEEIAHLIGANA